MADQGCLEGADQVESLFYSFSIQLDFDSSEAIKCLSALADRHTCQHVGRRWKVGYSIKDEVRWLCSSLQSAR
jgi:hypothetical protein